MLKLIGMILILSGAGGCGASLIRTMNLHLEQLLKVRDIFLKLQSGITYQKLPYPQLLRKTALSTNDLFAEILTEISSEMEKNRQSDAAVLWSEALEKRKEQLFLKEDEKMLLLALAKNLVGESQNTKACEIYFLQLEDKIMQSVKEKKEKQKLYETVSILCGLFLIVLLL